ncbi:hypothetical protein DEU56DRAFT_910784 [Suillus clintonianus]|uniref:uncharacterized protein n=1 Tax=Suillus clintonianus TaxID=1904413 RepID=UPI001B8688CE|nr:uncharacterized protein DEU56DRAFT_910784 [Suillus clintonianus]KAG2143658.1 hypothetical protein DEU56DRAFT_910784 [Suillus clintonianus]
MFTRDKKTEYSADNITAARSLQFLAYLCTSMAAFWTYDYACLLHEEWTFLLRSRWTKIKGLYIITRHAPFVFIVTELYRAFGSSTYLADGEFTYCAPEYFTPNENTNTCRMSLNVHSCFGIISIGCSECISPSPPISRAPDLINLVFFVLRTYALWSNNRTILAAVLSAFLVSPLTLSTPKARGECNGQGTVVASIVVGFITVAASQVTTSAIPGLPACFRTSTSFMQFLLLFAFQLGLITLTLIRAILSWRTNNGPLYANLVKHNISYYASVLSAVNVLILMLFDGSAYHSLFEDFEVLILAILATRMHLHLWHIDRDARGSDAIEMTCLSDMVPAEPVAYSALFVE